MSLRITNQPNYGHRRHNTNLVKNKTKLKQKLGDPDCREKWLEGLATAQATETGGDLAKRLQHLMCTEEQ